MSHSEPFAEERTYQIGTVATLTGIDPQTIRAWERRYGAIKPMRTSTGRRRYDDATVERLQLLKALVDSSEAIGVIASLSDEDLRERLYKVAEHERNGPHGDLPRTAAIGPHRLAIFGAGVAEQARANPGVLPEFEIDFASEDRETFLESARRNGCDVVLVELEADDAAAFGFVRMCRDLPGQPLVVVLYRFAKRPLLARLASTGAVLVGMPIRLAQLRRILLDQLMIGRLRARRAPGAALPGAIAPAPEPDEAAASTARRFDDAQLARLLEMTGSVDCECPNHVSSLVAALVAFEAYSDACESRDEADAALHRRLATGTAKARVQMETLLTELCAHEGLEV